MAASLCRRGFNLYFAGTRWLYDTLSGLAARGSNSYLEVTYEDLVSSPDAILRRIFNHLGAEPDFEFTTGIRDPADNHGVYEEHWNDRKEPRAWNQTPADPISTASIGKYKKAFTEKELSTLYRIRLSDRAADSLNTDVRTFGDLIDHLGYTSISVVSRYVPVGQRLHEKYLELEDYLRS